MGKLVVVIPDELHRKLKHRAIDTGVTLRELVIVYMDKGLE